MFWAGTPDSRVQNFLGLYDIDCSTVELPDMVETLDSNAKLAYLTLFSWMLVVDSTFKK